MTASTSPLSSPRAVTPNPLLTPWDAPFGLPPFHALRPEHFPPALREAMAAQRTELEAIAAQTEAQDFDNTIAALDRSGRLLARIEAVFWNLTASETSAELQAVQREMAAPLAAHGNAIYQHQGLFARLQAVHARRAESGLDGPAQRLVERTHLDFVRAGAALAAGQRARCAALSERLADLHTAFAQNVLAEEAAYALPLQGEADLAGLPDFVRTAAAQAATDRRHPAGHVITLSRSLIVPFLTFSKRRDLRERAWRAWTSRGEAAGAHDNRAIAAEILLLRGEFARLLGYKSYADYALADTMAGTQARVDKLFDDVWPRACDALERERRMLQSTMAAQGVSEPIEPWDWRYWAQQVRLKDFAIDEAEFKPYFPLDRMVQAAFDCAERLFGIRMVARADIAAYHPDVQAWEVLDAQGRSAGLFLHDNFARASKRSGAWMSTFRNQTRHAGVPVLPIVVNNNNFAKAPPGEPALLSSDDVRTLFHEFGHGLHGLLSNVTWERQSGTAVLRDFVELPSQLFEHWITEPQVLQRHARHWKTGEPIPAALVQRLKRAQSFGQGFETVRFVASAIVDMRAHAAAQAPTDVVAFEAGVLRQIGHPSGVGMNHRLVHFQHLFSGSSYAAGYYVYLWAEVLDADAYEAFVEAGDPFDRATASRLLKHIYSAGDSVDPQETYLAFRGRPAQVQPLLRKRGLLTEAAA
jgi:peptidyl-dipeptidase Dcp